MLILFLILLMNMVAWDEIKTQLSRELWNKWFICLGISIFLFFCAFKLTDSNLLKVVSVFFFIFSFRIYLHNTKFDNNNQKNAMWILFLLIFFLSSSYASITISRSPIAVIISVMMLIFFILTIPAAVLGGSIHLLLHSKSLKYIIIFYLFLILATIIIFGFLFALLSGFEGNELRWTDNKTVVSDVDGGIFNTFNYFSALVFYSNTFGDITPFGVSKFLVFIELVFSFIIHTIVLARTVDSDYVKRRFNRKVKN